MWMLVDSEKLLSKRSGIVFEGLCEIIEEVHVDVSPGLGAAVVVSENPGVAVKVSKFIPLEDI
jgi:hypothetical protein